MDTTRLPPDGGSPDYTLALEDRSAPDARAMAEEYLARGYPPIPVQYLGKQALGRGWQDQRPTPQDLDRLFPATEPRNVGLLLGAPAGGLVEIGRASCRERGWTWGVGASVQE